jgi:hypothetical protein
LKAARRLDRGPQGRAGRAVLFARRQDAFAVPGPSFSGRLMHLHAPRERGWIPMFLPEIPKSDDVEHLLRNAQLRDELEPLFDESIGRVNPTAMTTRTENEFLESMLEWERAPILPIYQWFNPPLVLPHPDRLNQQQLSVVLRATIDKLFEKHIVIDFADHLSDYQLYGIIFRDILPSHEKMLERRTSYLHWDCANTDDNPETWLRYYATQAEREMWAEESGQPLPPRDEPPFSRKLPRAPM